MKAVRMIYGGINVNGDEYPSVEAARHVFNSALRAEKGWVSKMRPSPYTKKVWVITQHHKGYYNSFGSPHAADEYITTQKEEGYWEEVNIPEYEVATSYAKHLAKKCLQALDEM
jgi:hypothetical protein